MKRIESKTKSMESEQLAPRSLCRFATSAKEKKVVRQEEEVRFLESVARSHDEKLSRTREEVFTHSQNMIEDISIEHGDEADDLKRRIDRC